MCCDKTNLTIPLAADTNVNPFFALTACILAIHLCLNAYFIDIYELFFGNVFDFFQICVYLFEGLLLVDPTLFFSRDTELSQPLKDRGQSKYSAISLR